MRQLVNTPASDKATPLYIAAQEGHHRCVAVLLEHGADPSPLIPFIERYGSLPPISVTALQIALVKKSKE